MTVAAAATPTASSPLGRLAGALLLVLAVAWLPGQTRASATRLWVACGVLPFFLLELRAPRLGRQALWLLPGAALAVFSLASAVWVRDPGGAAETFLIQASWTCALALGLLLKAGAEDGQCLARWVAAAGGAAALPGLLADGGSFGNPSLLAGFLSLTSVYTLALLLTPSAQIKKKPKGSRGHVPWRGAGAEPLPGNGAEPLPGRGAEPRNLKPLLVLLAGLQLAALIRCESLGSWLALAAGMGAWYAGHCLRSGRRRAVGLAGLAGVVAAVALWIHPPATVRDHMLGRLHLCRTTVEVALAAFPLGVGAGQLHGAFLEAQADVLDRHPEARRFWSNAYHAHNEALHVVAEQGVLGLLLLIPWIAALLRPQAAAAGGAVVALATLSLVSFPLYEPATWVLGVLSLGLTLGGPVEDPASTRSAWSRLLLSVPASARPRWSRFLRPDPASARPRWSRFLLLGIALVCGCLASAQWLGDRLLASGIRSGSEAVLQSAASFSLRPAAALQHRAALLQNSAPEAAEQLALRAVALDPSARGWLLAGIAAMRRHSPVRAIAAFREAVRLNPRLFAGHFNLALALEESGDHSSARRHAQRARSLRPGDRRLQGLPR